jgi:hypothetical protein
VTVILLTFRLVDESSPTQSLSSSGRDAEVADAPQVTKLAPEAAPKVVAHRVKHKANEKKSMS